MIDAPREFNHRDFSCFSCFSEWDTPIIFAQYPLGAAERLTSAAQLFSLP